MEQQKPIELILIAKHDGVQIITSTVAILQDMVHATYYVGLILQKICTYNNLSFDSVEVQRILSQYNAYYITLNNNVIIPFSEEQLIMIGLRNPQYYPMQ